MALKKKVKASKKEEQVEEPEVVAEANVEEEIAASPRPSKKRARANSEEVVGTASEPKADEEEVVSEPAKKKKKKNKAVAVAEEEDANVPATTEAEAAAATAESNAEAAKDAVGRTVFVDGLSYEWDTDKVTEHFGECGKIVDIKAPKWQDTGRLRGFAHITFADKAGMKKALALDGTSAGKKNRYLKIEKAKCPTSVSGTTIDIEGKRRLFVKNLPYDVEESEIGDVFGPCGKIVEIRIPTSNGHGKGFAYVEFAGSKALKAAIEMDPAPTLRGRTLRLDADGGSGPKAGFKFRKDAFGSGYGPDSNPWKSNAGANSSGGDGKGKGKGKDGKGKDGKGKGKGKMPKMSLF